MRQDFTNCLGCGTLMVYGGMFGSEYCPGCHRQPQLAQAIAEEREINTNSYGVIVGGTAGFLLGALLFWGWKGALAGGAFGAFFGVVSGGRVLRFAIPAFFAYQFWGR